MQTGQILKNMRKSANLTQAKLAEKLNMADTTISSYERENSQPDFETIVKIANICGYELILIDKNNSLIALSEMEEEKDY